MKVPDPCLAASLGAKKAIVFDLFHTLASLESAWSAGSRMTCDVLGVSRETWDRQLQRKSRDRLVGSRKDPFDIIAEMAHSIDPSIPDEQINAATRNRIEGFATALREIPAGTVAALHSLKMRGKRLGLISNADVMELAAWDKSPIRHLFDSTIFSCVVGCMKPEREIYEISLRELDASPDESVFVGDGDSYELGGAKNVGMTTIMITGAIMELSPERIAERRRHADFVIEQVSDLTVEVVKASNE